MDTIKRTVSSNPAAVAARQAGRPLAVDVTVELRNGNTGVSARAARTMGSDDDWTHVLTESLQQQDMANDAVDEDIPPLTGGPQPITLATVQALRVQEAVEALQRMATGSNAQRAAVSKVGNACGWCIFLLYMRLSKSVSRCAFWMEISTILQTTPLM